MKIKLTFPFLVFVATTANAEVTTILPHAKLNSSEAKNGEDGAPAQSEGDFDQFNFGTCDLTVKKVLESLKYADAACELRAHESKPSFLSKNQRDPQKTCHHLARTVLLKNWDNDFSKQDVRMGLYDSLCLATDYSKDSLPPQKSHAGCWDSLVKHLPSESDRKMISQSKTDCALANKLLRGDKTGDTFESCISRRIKFYLEQNQEKK